MDGMNATTSAFLAIPRWNRIQFVSRLAKYVCYGVLLYSSSFFFFISFRGASDLAVKRSTAAAAMVAAQLGWWVAFVILQRKPDFNERFRLLPLMGMAQIFWWVGFCESVNHTSESTTVL